MTDKTPDSEERKSQQSSSSQNVRQDIGTNEGQVQGVGTGRDANVIQGENNLLINTLNVLLGRQEATSQGQIQRPKTERLMLEQVKNEVAARFNQSLHNRVYILLDKEEDISQVNPPWAIDVKVGTKPPERLSSSTKITDIYDREEINGRLLILGAPGSGKTTTLLQLAQVLVNRAQEDINQPIPVLLNLSSWKEDKESIKDWIIDELKQKYGVRKDIGKKWLDEATVIPLLDGLDELASLRQSLCVKQINDFLQAGSWLSSLVVCSRTEEFHRLATPLELNGAIILQPLTEEQIRDYLYRTGEEALWKSIKNDAKIMELAQTPLFVNIMLLSYEEISFLEWGSLESKEERLSHLFDAYIKRMLGRPYQKKKPKPKDVSTQHWLGWLAFLLSQTNQTEFLIEKIQPYWLNNKRQRQRLIYELIYTLFTGLIGGLIGGLTGWLIGTLIGEPIGKLIAVPIAVPIAELIVGPITGLIVGLIAGLIAGLIVGLISGSSEKIIPWETISYSSSVLIRGLIAGLMGGLGFALYAGVFAGLSAGVFAGLIFGLIFGLSSGLMFGLSGKEINIKNTPNQGIKKNLENAKYISAIIGLILISFLLVIWQILPDFFSAYNLLRARMLIILVGGYIALFSISFTNYPVIQHFSLRVVVWLYGYAPWNYARFLDYATDRLFLQRVGGGYRFIHRLLQEHFAQMFNPQYYYYKKGLAYFDQQDYERAIYYYSQGIKLNPQSAEAYGVRGDSYLAQKDYQKAIEDYTQVIRLKPQYAAFAYCGLGIVHHKQLNYTAALSDYKQVLAKDEKYLPVIINIGLIKYEQGVISEAMKQWQQVININPDSAESKLALAVAVYAKGEQDKALKMAEVALKLDKRFADLEYLKENLWGERLLADAQKLLSNPKIKAFVSSEQP